MTDEMMNLRALLQKSSDVGLLREMIGFTAQRLMELEVESLTGAAYGAKTQERVVQRNGYRDRSWETRAGTAELRIPKLRKGSYSQVFWSRADSPRKPARHSCRRPTYTECQPAPSIPCCQPLASQPRG